jgi:hypothetical protein
MSKLFSFFECPISCFVCEEAFQVSFQNANDIRFLIHGVIKNTEKHNITHSPSLQSQLHRASKNPCPVSNFAMLNPYMYYESSAAFG